MPSTAGTGSQNVGGSRGSGGNGPTTTSTNQGQQRRKATGQSDRPENSLSAAAKKSAVLAQFNMQLVEKTASKEQIKKINDYLDRLTGLVGIKHEESGDFIELLKKVEIRMHELTEQRMAYKFFIDLQRGESHPEKTVDRIERSLAFQRRDLQQRNTMLEKEEANRQKKQEQENKLKKDNRVKFLVKPEMRRHEKPRPVRNTDISKKQDPVQTEIRKYLGQLDPQFED